MNSRLYKNLAQDQFLRGFDQFWLRYLYNYRKSYPQELMTSGEPAHFSRHPYGRHRKRIYWYP